MTIIYGHVRRNSSLCRIRNTGRGLVCAFLVYLVAAAVGPPARAAGEPATAVPTFESLGLYYNRAAAKDILWSTTSGRSSTADRWLA